MCGVLVLRRGMCFYFLCLAKCNVPSLLILVERTIRVQSFELQSL